MDKTEQGLPNIKVKVGKQSITTDQEGRYLVKVRASRVAVGLPAESIPEGYVSSTSLLEKMDILQGKTQNLNFGLTTHSGIYGVVYLDINGSGIPDEGDEFISGVKLVLDGKEITRSDFEGSYFFTDIEPGKHIVTIDVNSIPLQYIPNIKLKHEIIVAEGTTYVLHVPLRKMRQD